MATRESLMRGGAWVGRFVIGGAFLYAGAMKLMNPADFATDISHFRLVPHPIALGLSVYLPWLEIACALGVICRWRERGALAVLALLCAMFSLALTSAAARGLNIHCGCFGESTGATLIWSIARAALLGGLALALLRYTRNRSECNASIPDLLDASA